MILYNLVVRLYGFIIRLVSFRSKKAGQWLAGRRNWQEKLAGQLAGLNGGKIIWVHCASYGEFEQGRPLIEAVKARQPGYNVVLSFFSPSGYEAFKNWKGADIVCYLPLDTRRNADRFIQTIQPVAAIFIKYEFWVNYLFALRDSNIPTFLVSAVFKPHHPFFKWYGSLFRKSLKTFSRLFLQDEASGVLLQRIGITNYEVCGDTRFDRVMQIKQGFAPLPFFESVCEGRPVLVAGSTWPGDEEMLIDTYKTLNNPSLLMVLVPHEVSEASINALLQRLKASDLSYQQYSSQLPEQGRQILVVDAMGLLSRIYHYATVAYVGGGFNSGIHNCLEPAVYLKPVVFYGGADYHKYNEAVDMLNNGAARNVKNAGELSKTLAEFLGNAQLLKDVEKVLDDYFKRNAGSTDKILKLIDW